MKFPYIFTHETQNLKPTQIFVNNEYLDVQGGPKKTGISKKFKIALSHSILKLKSIVIPINQMSQSGEKDAQV